jgi:hypothetical protein
MTPEEHRDAAQRAFDTDRGAALATYHAAMGVLEALLQMDTCGHGTRGFCKDCFWLEFRQWPISVKEQGSPNRF